MTHLKLYAHLLPLLDRQEYRRVKPLSVAHELTLPERTVRHTLMRLVATGYLERERSGHGHSYRIASPAQEMQRAS